MFILEIFNIYEIFYKILGVLVLINLKGMNWFMFLILLRF